MMFLTVVEKTRKGAVKSKNLVETHQRLLCPCNNISNYRNDAKSFGYFTRNY